MTVKLALTKAQMLQGALIGCMRHVQNLANGRQPRYGAGRLQDWQLGIEGCLGEMVVALYLGTFWDGKVGDLSNGDVGKIEVRTTAHENGRLILHPADHAASRFVLVTGLNGNYTLRGWILGADGQDKAFWSDPGTGRPAFFVPQDKLQPIATLMGAGQ